MKTIHRRLAWTLLCVALLAGCLLVIPNQTGQALNSADQAFTATWARADQAVATGAARSSWFWGPVPRSSRTELYQESPGGQRLVQYYDKGRLEINNPSANRASSSYVTGGLLCSELVTGRVQVGNSRYENREPAAIPVGGDLDSPAGPTYATFRPVSSLNNNRRAPARSGRVSDYIDRAGQVSAEKIYPDQASYAYYETRLGHNIPDVFINWLDSLGGRGLDWQALVGLPITEPYWATFNLGGTPREIMVQLFERRVLTFNPQNAPEWQVEMGNVGLHYWNWRYNVSISAVDNAFGLDNEEQRVFDLVNQYRQANGLPPLYPNATLTRVARWMSQDMADKYYFNHIDSQGRDPFKRMLELGYPGNTYRGENLAAGFDKAEAAVKAWQKSPGHNQNLLNGNYHFMGISRIYNPSSPYRWYWSTEFGGLNVN